jgi:hypothetical protein
MRLSAKTRASLTAIAIFILALAVRVMNLGQFLTTDEPEGWLGKSIRFSQAILEGRLGDTFQHYSPGVTLMWSGSLGLYLNYLFNPGPAPNFAGFLQTLPFDPIAPGLIFWFRLPNVLIGAGCIAIGYLYARRLFGSIIALGGSLLLAFDPLLIGMNRILGHDGLAASTMMVSALVAIVFFSQLEKAQYGTLALSALFAGFAMLAKSTAFFMLPFVGLTALMTAFYEPRAGRLKKHLLDLLLWAVLVAAAFFIFWPALWTHPVQTIQNMFAGLAEAAVEPHNRGSFFWGAPIPDPGLSFYWVAVYFRLTAVTTIGLILGVVYLVRHAKTLRLNFKSHSQPPQHILNDRLLALLLALAFILFYLLFLSFGSKKQDRYIVPILPMAAFVAAAGYVWLAQLLKRKYWQYGLLSLVVAVQAIIAYRSAPYYLTHYNWLAGGNRVASNVLLIGWGEGLDLAAAYLNTLPGSETKKVASWYHSAFEPYFAGQALEEAGDEKISRSSKPALAADYVVLYINQIQRQMPTPGLIQFYQSFKPVHVVTIDGIDYAAIYPSPAMQRAFSGQVRLVGQAELLGYSLLDTQGHPLTAISADGSATLQLYWEWQGKAFTDPIGVSVVDANGQVWAKASPLGSTSPIPIDQWAEGAIIHDIFTLKFFPGTPPGTYYIKAWIERPIAAERVGDFPLQLEDATLTVTRPKSLISPADLPLTNQLDLPVTSGITLLGYHTTFANPWQPGQEQTLTLYWQANQNVTQNYPVTLALGDTNGDTRAEWTGLPTGGHFPTEQWQAGDIIRDAWRLTLPPHTPPGEYTLTAKLGHEARIDLLTVAATGRPRLFEPPQVGLELKAHFGESIDLLGLNAPGLESTALKIVSGRPLPLELIWQAAHLVGADYTLTVQLLDGQSQVIAQTDTIPLNGTAPTTSWAVGEVLIDRVTLDIPPETGSAPHQLLIALYRAETGERLLLPAFADRPNGADHLTIPVEIGD